MLPHAGQTCWWFARGLLLVLAVVAGACAERATPEQQVRAVLGAAERAAEARDLSGVLEHVAPDFSDGQGGGRDDLKQSLRGYFVTHPSVHLSARIESVEFPYRDLARVRLAVGTLALGRERTVVPDIDADMKNVVLELRLEDDAWRVVRAEWR